MSCSIFFMNSYFTNLLPIFKGIACLELFEIYSVLHGSSRSLWYFIGALNNTILKWKGRKTNRPCTMLRSSNSWKKLIVFWLVENLSTIDTAGFTYYLSCEAVRRATDCLVLSWAARWLSLSTWRTVIQRGGHTLILENNYHWNKWFIGITNLCFNDLIQNYCMSSDA